MEALNGRAGHAGVLRDRPPASPRCWPTPPPCWATAPAAVARELTKFYETVRRGDLASLAESYARRDAPKGEIVVLIGPPSSGRRPRGRRGARRSACARHLDRMSVKDAVAVVVQETGLPRKRVYARAVALKG